MKNSQRRALPRITAAGKGEERALQIQHIQERMARLQRVHEQIASEIRQLTDDVKTLADEPAPPPPSKEPNWPAPSALR